MPIGSLIERLPSKTVAWGRCYTVTAAGLDSADAALETIADDANVEDLLALEALGSTRISSARSRLGEDPEGRPRGPFSAIVLDALSIRANRGELSDEVFGGWVCYLRKEDALEAARLHWTEFFASSGASDLELKLQVYSARIGGNFISRDDFTRHLSGSRSANDPESIANELSLLWRAGIDGILLATGEAPAAAAIVLRGSAVSHVRPHEILGARWAGAAVTIVTDESEHASRVIDAESPESQLLARTFAGCCTV